MTDFKTQALGAVLPPGSTSPTGTLPEGGYSITVDGFDESGLVRCVYPDGFVKHHQAEAVDDLAGKVARQVQARYGASDVQFTGVPKAIKAGATFTAGG